METIKKYISREIEYDEKNLKKKKTLIDFISGKTQNIVLLAGAGMGKSTELKNISEELKKINSEYNVCGPFDLCNYTDESIDEFIDFNKKNDTVLIFDGYDELLSDKISVFKRKLNTFISKNKEQIRNIVISSRTNFYSYSKQDSMINGSLDGFIEVKLLPITQIQINSIIEIEFGNNNNFMELIYKNKLQDIIKIPFYLLNLIQIYKKENQIPCKAKLFNKLIEYNFTKDINKFNNVEEFQNQEFKIEKPLQKIAFSLQLLNQEFILNEDCHELLSTEEIKYINYSGIWSKDKSDSWKFIHALFREYLASEYMLDLKLEKIKKLITYEEVTDMINLKWVNVLGFLFESDRYLYQNNLIDWVLEIDPVILTNFEFDFLSNEKKSELLIKIFEKCKEKNLYFSDIKLDIEKCIKYAASKKVFLYLIETLKESKDKKIILHNVLNALSYFEEFYEEEEALRKMALDILDYEEGISNEDYKFVKIMAICLLSNHNLFTPEIENIILEKYNEDEKYLLILFIENMNFQEKYKFILKSFLDSDLCDESIVGNRIDNERFFYNCIQKIEDINLKNEFLEEFEKYEDRTDITLFSSQKTNSGLPDYVFNALFNKEEFLRLIKKKRRSMPSQEIVKVYLREKNLNHEEINDNNWEHISIELIYYYSHIENKHIELTENQKIYLKNIYYKNLSYIISNSYSKKNIKLVCFLIAINKNFTFEVINKSIYNQIASITSIESLANELTQELVYDYFCVANEDELEALAVFIWNKDEYCEKYKQEALKYIIEKRGISYFYDVFLEKANSIQLGIMAENKDFIEDKNKQFLEKLKQNANSKNNLFFLEKIIHLDGLFVLQKLIQKFKNEESSILNLNYQIMMKIERRSRVAKLKFLDYILDFIELGKDNFVKKYSSLLNKIIENIANKNSGIKVYNKLNKFVSENDLDDEVKAFCNYNIENLKQIIHSQYNKAYTILEVKELLEPQNVTYYLRAEGDINLKECVLGNNNKINKGDK